MVSTWQVDVFCYAILAFRDHTSKVAAAHAELDRNEPLVALPKNVGCTGVERDGGELLERDVRVGIATLNAYLEVLDGGDAVAILGGEPNSHRELPVSF